MFDRVFVNAVDADGNPLNLAVREGRLAAIGPERPAIGGAEVVDLAGHLVLPGFVDGHIHLDKSFVGDRWRPHRHVTSLRERLAIEKQELASAGPIVERADALIRQAASFGTIAMRSHVDVDATTGLTNLHAVMEAREKWRGVVDIELVAFPQAGVVSCPGTAEVLDAAAREGAQVVGGIDPTTLDGDADGQLDIVFGIAEKRGVKIDIHLHEPEQQGIDQLHRIASRTRAAGLNGRVSVSHAYGLGDVAPEVVDRIAAALAEAGVSIMTNAPGDRAFPPILQLRAAGVRVFTGNDNIQDAWWPYGNGDMLQRAMLVGYRSGFYTDEELGVGLRMATEAGAAVLGKGDYGLKVGNEATFVVVKAPNAAAAVAAVPAERAIVRSGQFWGDSSRLLFKVTSAGVGSVG
ncbi:MULTISPECIES: amidohydrolase family protein [Paraburkholderia]|uniref:amidohydrolase family protein n=1 Tax=Paraburkholderia TaxID=1822464 RepID=UPI001B03EC5F|nr:MULTISPECIES: amidohydrolase family protein [Paraburkholderia]MCX4139515.1 amidohydrolase family protein [Paraburkholderia aspalathi]MCX4155461.1 amidohydrolase family protein [Paraburkholderia aspalathi]MDN7164869.1 amidohydrolase family protein [Paraburkholderia sp. SECH2]MDN7172202.1 amidohydrolase family protein [Paraburkholderia sp. SEWSISQ10-3 4]MDQ6393355.1 amidohydrolase family protein [Paraburkholderia aspalathi]